MHEVCLRREKVLGTLVDCIATNKIDNSLRFIVTTSNRKEPVGHSTRCRVLALRLLVPAEGLHSLLPQCSVTVAMIGMVEATQLTGPGNTTKVVGEEAYKLYSYNGLIEGSREKCSRVDNYIFHCYHYR